jgi:quercetin dioxygenase-like cupin family protein
VKHWSRAHLEGMVGRHLSSSAWARVQVVEAGHRHRPPFRVALGEVIVLCLEGTCQVTVTDRTVELTRGDQVLVEEGESFALRSDSPDRDALVELIWVPGPEKPYRSPLVLSPLHDERPG